MLVFDRMDTAVKEVLPDQYIVALEWQGRQFQFAAVTEPHCLPDPKLVIMQAPRGIQDEDLIIVNPNPLIGKFVITREQYKALRLKYERNADGAKSFNAFKNRVQIGGIGADHYVLLPWCGMWVGIEPDGHAHT